MTAVQHPPENLAWYAMPAEVVAGRMGVNPGDGLDAGEAERRLAEGGEWIPRDEALLQLGLTQADIDAAEDVEIE